MDLKKFQNDVNLMTDKLAENLQEHEIPKLIHVRQQLIEMYKKKFSKNQPFYFRINLCK